MRKFLLCAVLVVFFLLRGTILVGAATTSSSSGTTAVEVTNNKVKIGNTSSTNATFNTAAPVFFSPKNHTVVIHMNYTLYDDTSPSASNYIELNYLDAQGNQLNYNNLIACQFADTATNSWDGKCTASFEASSSEPIKHIKLTATGTLSLLLEEIKFRVDGNSTTIKPGGDDLQCLYAPGTVLPGATSQGFAHGATSDYEYDCDQAGYGYVGSVTYELE